MSWGALHAVNAKVTRANVKSDFFLNIVSELNG